MKKCDYCGSTIFFGGVRDNDLRFCNDKCHQNGFVFVAAQDMPKDVVQQQAMEVRQGSCPKCQGSGPIDVHTSHRVYSLLLYTSWKSNPQICCHSCGVKSKVGNTIFSFLFGWWGFPWGFIMTPVQIGKNIAGLLKGTDETKPSEQLKKMVSINLAAYALEHQNENNENTNVV